MLSLPLYAANNKLALLVGISEYHVKPLSGPLNDVNAVKSALTKHWDFKEKNIEILLNKRATKDNIIKSIKNLYTISKPGDLVFIYLSGHGTSASDKDLSTPLPTTTGAFIPVDVKDLKNISELVNKLVIGRKDLRPLLKKFDDNNRNVFVAIDACYSGNTVRGSFAKEKLPTRFLRASDLLPNRGFGDDVSEMKTSDWKKAEITTSNSYPYSNVYYLSASGEHEPAQDIPENMLDRFPTIDNKPHGAFTDSLLRVLNKELHSDVNNDGNISYAELKKTIRDTMRTRGFNHTPQGLPSLAEDKHNLSNRAIFKKELRKNDKKPLIQASINKPTQQTTSTLQSLASPKPESKPSLNTISSPIASIPQINATHLLVKLDKGLDFFKREIDALKNIDIVKENEDIFITKIDKKIAFLSATGDLINTLIDIDRPEMMAILTRHAWLKQNLTNKSFDDFLLELELHNQGSGGTVIEGQIIGFSLRSSAPAFLLLIDVDPNGEISVIYPYFKSEVKKFAGSQPILFKNLTRVRAPFGRDTVQAYAFDKITTEYENLIGKSFKPGDPLMKKFEKLIHNPGLQKARSNLEVITAPSYQ